MCIHQYVKINTTQESASRTLMLGVLWPVVHITQHPEPMCPAVANTSSNSRLGDVCQSQLWPMGSSHTLSHSINSNRYLTQMCHAYPDIAFTLTWHNSRGNIINTNCDEFTKLYIYSTLSYSEWHTHVREWSQHMFRLVACRWLHGYIHDPMLSQLAPQEKNA